MLIAGMLWRGPSHALLEHVRAGTLSLVSSPALLAQLADVIGRAKFDAILTRTNTSHERSLAEVRQLAEVIEPPPLPQPVVHVFSTAPTPVESSLVVARWQAWSSKSPLQVAAARTKGR